MLKSRWRLYNAYKCIPATLARSVHLTVVTPLTEELFDEITHYNTARRISDVSFLARSLSEKHIVQMEFQLCCYQLSQNRNTHCVSYCSLEDANNDERLDVNNDILLSPNYDALVDRHLISFENRGKIILSNAVLKSDYNSLGVSGKEVISNLSRENHLYLERHRDFLNV